MREKKVERKKEGKGVKKKGRDESNRWIRQVERKEREGEGGR